MWMFSAADSFVTCGPRVSAVTGLFILIYLVLLFPSFHFFLGSKHNVDTAVIIDVVLSFCICIHLETLNVGNNCVVSSNHFDAITLF